MQLPKTLLFFGGCVCFRVAAAFAVPEWTTHNDETSSTGTSRMEPPLPLALPRTRSLLRFGGGGGAIIGRPPRRGVITGFELINTLTNQAIAVLTDNQVIALSDISGMESPSFNIRARTSGPVSAVVYQHGIGAAAAASHRDTQAPWTLCGSDSTAGAAASYATCPSLSVLGVHTITATPYSARRRRGILWRSSRKGQSLTMRFTIVQKSTAKDPPSAPVPPANGTAPPQASIATIAPTPSPLTSPSKPVAAAAPIKSVPPTPVVSPALATPSPMIQPSPIIATPPLVAPSTAAASVAPVSPPVVADLKPSTPTTTTPVAAPTKAPSVTPTKTPIVTSTKTPVVTSNKAPITDPTDAPIRAPMAPAPVKAPTKPPKTPSTPPPVSYSPTKAPAHDSSLQCTIPKLLGNTWISGTKYPLTVAESQGAMMNNSFVIFSGFYNQWTATTVGGHALDTTNNPNSGTKAWQKLDDIPVAPGLTHTAFVVVGTRMYLCGGYVGGTPGPQTDACLVYDHSRPTGTQWSSMAKLPNTGRAGGGMVYDTSSNALYFSAGATRVAGTNHATDHNSTWMYSFDSPNDGWIPKAAIPFKGNHISFVTTRDSQGRERHYFSGGQREENEHNGNNDYHYEYIVTNNTWVKRQSLPMPRGHASSSTHAYGCGYLVIGGCTNGGKQLSEGPVYSVETDSWVKIGILPEALNTPVCDINRNTNMLHCETGHVSKGFSFKRQISL